MALRKLGQDPESPDGKSPTLHVDDEKGTYLVQGWKRHPLGRQTPTHRGLTT